MSWKNLQHQWSTAGGHAVALRAPFGGFLFGFPRTGGTATAVPATTTATTTATANLGQPNHLVIIASYDTTITSSPYAANIEAAIQAAISYYDNLITNPITLNITFTWGNIGSSAAAQSSFSYYSLSYATVNGAVQSNFTTSAVQRAAAASLTSTDPTGGGTFDVNTAQAKVLGLTGASGSSDGTVTLNSAIAWTWAQPNIAGGTYDAVGVLEHEISEVMGRWDNGGRTGQYTLLDMFRYTAPGSRSLLSSPGYDLGTTAYFSYDGTHLATSLPYNTLNNGDLGDWSGTTGDSYGPATAGVQSQITATDLQELNVIGYDLSCYVAGTRIATPGGAVAVEALRVGDRVVSAFGGAVEVTWLGHRRVDCRRHPRPQDVWPVRITAGAFGAGLPGRDLLLSPDHAVFAGGVLIPVRHLINDATIVQEPAAVVTYWHVEVPRHDVLLAEGLACESYLDTGNRGAFDNGAAPTMLHADFALRVWEAEACARLVVAGPGLVAVRRALLARAEALGHAFTRDAGLALAVDGRLAAPLIEGRVYRFPLAPGGREGRLVSRRARPAAVWPAADDHRRLGVAVRRLLLDGSEVAPDDARLRGGWHAFESDAAGGGLRWTDGDAGLDLAGVGELAVEVAMTARYWVRAPLVRAAAAQGLRNDPPASPFPARGAPPAGQPRAGQPRFRVT